MQHASVLIEEQKQEVPPDAVIEENDDESAAKFAIPEKEFLKNGLNSAALTVKENLPIDQFEVDV